MSRVYILRHAKAASPLPGMKDFDRALTASGHETSERLGALMMARGFVPRCIVASPSRRTRETLEGVAKFFHRDVPMLFDQAMYAHESEFYLASIRAQTADSILIVGHNPMCEDSVHTLVSSGNPDAMTLMAIGMPPGTLAVIDLPGPLAEARSHSGFLENYIVNGQ